MMFKIIMDIFNSPINQSIAFKGGTLCYFLYNLPRFSVDLDFDYLGNDFENDKKLLKNILITYGVLKQETDTKLIIKYNELQRPLKIEWNRRIAKNDFYEIINFYGKDIKVMRLDCIVANKMIAQTQRKNKIAKRDLFDIHFFLQQGYRVNKDLIQEQTGKSYTEYLKYLIQFIKDNFTQNNVLEGLGELLDEQQKYRVKNHLINETISLLQFELFNQK